MLLYLWVNKYKHIEQTGFNLSSYYEFNFELDKTNSNDRISGQLTCVKKDSLKIFNEKIVDLKAIIGKNGSGKSTIFELLINNILTESSLDFDGFLIADSFIFSRNEYNFGNSLDAIKDIIELKVITNFNLRNYGRKESQRKVRTEEIVPSKSGQIATTYLNKTSIILYSPLLNLDRIEYIEGLVGSSRKWETDYWRFYDCSTENCIVTDYNAYNFNVTNRAINGQSELIAHKSEESKRFMEFLSNQEYPILPFKNKIEKATICINNSFKWFFEKVILVAENPESKYISLIEAKFVNKSIDDDTSIKQLRSNIYLSFLYGALKLEYLYLKENTIESKSITALIGNLIESLDKSANYEGALTLFLGTAKFSNNTSNEKLLGLINGIIDFVTSNDSINVSKDSFTISLSDNAIVKGFLKTCYTDLIFTDEENILSFFFNIFEINFVGLSSGEKNFLSMFSRIASVKIPDSQSEVIFLLDEPEVTLHPHWQVMFINIIVDYLPKLFTGKNIQILISSHSPMLISDIPKNNILFLDKDINDKCIVSDLNTMKNTFGANVHDLLANSFFLKNGFMGDFAKKKINSAIEYLQSTINNVKYLNTEKWDKDNVRLFIDSIGEPMLKRSINELYYLAFFTGNNIAIDEEIERLKKLRK